MVVVLPEKKHLTGASLAVQCVLLTLASAFLLRATSAQKVPCTVCRNGELVSLPEKQVEVPVLGTRTCAEIEKSVSSIFSVNSTYCDAVQDLGSLCGCPVPPTACRLCHDGSFVPYPNRLLGGLFVADFLEAAPAVAEEDPISCEVLEAVLHARDQASSVCTATQQEFSELCGCPEPPPPSVTQVGGEMTDNSDGGAVDEIVLDVPRETNRPPGCNVCKSGGEISLPDKQLDFDSFPVKDCSNLASFATALLPPESDECAGAQALGTFCGCPVPKDIRCTLCGNGERVKYPDQELDWFTDGAYSFLEIPDRFQDLASSLTCGLLESILDSFDEGSVSGVDMDAACFGAQFRSSICGCDPYWKEILLFWSYRVAGMLSILGSAFIMYGILFSGKPVNTYQQIMIGISSFDLVSSIGYVLPLLPESSGYYGAKGNEATCKLQAFMLQLGVTSMFYNIALSLYYLLVIKYNWKEFRFRKRRRYFHFCVVVLGFGLAFGAFPFYGHQLATCLVLFPPVGESPVPTTFFFTLPLMLTLVITTGATVIVFQTVYRQEKRALKWKARKNLDMTKKVFWQCFLYACSFYVTIPIRFITNYIDFDKENHIWVAVVTALVAPGQGLLNALVFRYRARGRVSFKCCSMGSRQEEVPPKDSLNKETAQSMTTAGGGEGPCTGAVPVDSSTGPPEHVRTSETEPKAMETIDADADVGLEEAPRDEPRTSVGSGIFSAAVEFWKSL